MLNPSLYKYDMLAYLGRFHEALRELELAIRVRGASGAALFDPRIVGRMGYFYAMLGREKPATEIITEAINLFAPNRQKHVADLSWLYITRGMLCLFTRKFSLAFEDLNKALELTHEQDLPRQEATILMWFGELDRYQDEQERAYERYRGAIELARSQQDSWLEYHIRLGLAKLDAYFGNSDELILQVEDILAIAQENGWLVQQIHAHVLLAHLGLAEGDLMDAHKHVQVARDLQKVSGFFWLNERLARLEEDVMEGR